MMADSRGKDGPRKSQRARKISRAMKDVGEVERQEAAQARLDALERDNAEDDKMFGMASDDEDFNVDESSDDEGRSKKRRGKGKPGKRKTRNNGLPSTFAGLLEEADLDSMPDGIPNYLTAAAGPPASVSARKFCSVCGFRAPYTCTRCRSRFCSRKCLKLHSETQCLKFAL